MAPLTDCATKTFDKDAQISHNEAMAALINRSVLKCRILVDILPSRETTT
jgi:hypothetical protein